MGFHELEENLIDMVKEQQAKLGVSPGGDPAVLSGLDAESLFRDR